jgi:uncharacterized protein involved in type VI secretion and phage assembly
MQSLEARAVRTFAAGTVRTLRAGTSLHITQSPLPEIQTEAQTEIHTEAPAPTHPGYNVIRVAHLGINNLPKPATDSLAELFGDVPELLGEVLQSLQAQTQSKTQGKTHSDTPLHTQRDVNGQALPLRPDALIQTAQELGYANQCELLRADLVWRPLITHEAGTSLFLIHR